MCESLMIKMVFEVYFVEYINIIIQMAKYEIQFYKSYNFDSVLVQFSSILRNV